MTKNQFSFNTIHICEQSYKNRSDCIVQNIIICNIIKNVVFFKLLFFCIRQNLYFAKY